MNALLICPGRRESVSTLLESDPLVILPLLGKNLLEYWLEHLVQRGVRKVEILASDRSENIQRFVADGARWGLRVSVRSEARESTVAEARSRHVDDAAEWLPAPEDVVLLDHFPGASSPLFDTYQSYFAALAEWMPRAATPDRIGTRQLQPGVWVGLHCHISSQAELRAPCWIGEDVHIGSRAVIGPGAILEGRTFVDAEAEIVESVVAVSTLIGKRTEVRHSIAIGATLINWQLNSSIRVRDAFLLAGLEPTQEQFQGAGWFGRLTALLLFILLSPFALIAVLKNSRRRAPLVRSRLAERPCPVSAELLPGDALVYYELGDVDGVLRRWPQLINVMAGEFAWVGNRPLTPRQARTLAGDYERLWMAAPIGLISLGDAEGCPALLTDEARAHASYYSARAGWRLNLAVILRTLYRLTVGVPWSRHSESLTQLLRTVRVGERRSIRE